MGDGVEKKYKKHYQERNVNKKVWVTSPLFNGKFKNLLGEEKGNWVTIIYNSQMFQCGKRKPIKNMKKISLTQKSSDIFSNRSELINFNNGHSFS